MAVAGEMIDRFTLVRQLGAGGMGETWEAVRQGDHDFEQRVAIKLAYPQSPGTPEALEAFRREAALAASLRHPNIASVLDIDQLGGYMVCELIDGADLRSVLRAAPSGKLEPAVLVYVIAQIARGLSHAHRRVLRGRLSPVIHRDMSPGNVVVDYDGNLKIVDFGIAWATAGAGDMRESLKGKLSYMAPEHAMGARMDGRVDQYALGVIAYEALTGTRPNDGATDAQTLASILGGRHIPLSKRVARLDRGLCAVLERMLARDPEQRFPSLEALLDALVPFTPPLTIQRELATLVLRARQPHTIVRENGKFVSRPVLPPSEAAEPVPLPGLSFAADADAPTTTLSAEELDAVLLPDQEPNAYAAMAIDTRTITPMPVLHLPPSAAAPPTLEPSLRSDAPSIWQRLSASQALWHGLTILGAVLLALVIWLAFTPHALRFLGPAHPQ